VSGDKSRSPCNRLLVPPMARLSSLVRSCYAVAGGDRSARRVRDVAGDPPPVAPFIIELISGGVVLAWLMSSTGLILLAVIMHGTHNMSQQACSPFGTWHRSTQMPCAPLNLHQRVMHCLDQCLTELSELGDAHRPPRGRYLLFREI
jgi:hypothetical protein